MTSGLRGRTVSTGIDIAFSNDVNVLFLPGFLTSLSKGGREGDAPGASLGRDAFACASLAAFLRLPVPGNGRAPGGRGPYTGLCGGLPKARRVGALSPARPGRGCKVLPFGFLASLAPVVVRTYWCRRCHLGRVRVV